MFAVPLAFIAVLLALTWLPRIQSSAALLPVFWLTGFVLAAWTAVLAVRSRASGPPVLEVPRPRSQHYIQALCQGAVFVYWGQFWAPVYDFAPLIVAQLAFAYAFDILLSWSRRQPAVLGFGQFPIVFSINLFLWFRDEWFGLQFLMVAVGYLAKTFIRWERGGRLVHVFNPSAFTLGAFSLVLLLTGSTGISWGQEISTTFSLGPNVYMMVFLTGLVVMYFFSITTVVASSAVTLFAASAVYGAATGVPYFVDSEIPSAVFLGLHLLVTDPSTSPRTPLGRVVFGVMYGLGVVALYGLLGALGVPTFYDKLLCVPLLNLCVPTIDRAVAALGQRPILARLGLTGPIGTFNLAHMGVWMAFFLFMTQAGATDGMHRGDALPFWQQACAENRRGACERLVSITSSYCVDNSGWACNEIGRYAVEGQLMPPDPARAQVFFSRACEASFTPGCLNLLEPPEPLGAEPRVIDYRLLLREGGVNLMDMPEPDLYARACRHGWESACAKVSASR